MSAGIRILFYSKKTKGTTDGRVPIYMRLTINGCRFEVSTKLFARPEQWSSAAGRVKGNGEEAKQINALLDAFRIKANDFHREILSEGNEISVESFRKKWLGKQIDRPRMLLEIFQHHNNQVEALVKQEYAPATIKRYQTSLAHTRKFLQWKYGLPDIRIDKLNFEFLAEYEFWLKSVRKCNHNSSIKYLTNFKKIVNICLKNGWLQRNPFLGYKMTKREVERVHLTQEEINAISNKQLPFARVDQVRDIFLFSCYTGLAYVDVKNLSRSDIAIGIDSNSWIFTRRQKTETLSRIPLLPKALDILDKYANHPQCVNEGKLLPVLSNQKMNSYLKEIADLCGISKNLTTHTARHTFATTVTLTNGVPIESVSKMLGHKNIKTTEHYAKILDIKISADMKLLRDKINTTLV
ncbi:MAG TPA: site-specific integrase [Cyclobacteriaceae bacterium]|nr:site-specific integrase [Cyclobacteriaceae bacterium]